MDSIQSIFGRISVLMLTALSLAFVAVPIHGQDSDNPPPQESRNEEAEIPIENLQVQLRPMTQEELQAELAKWMALVRQKIQSVGAVELELKILEPGDEANQAKEQLLELRKQEIALVHRAQTVIDALKKKGGDPSKEQMFLDSVSKLEETTDMTSYWTALTASFFDWIGDKKGGRLLGRRIVYAALVFLLFWLISKFAGGAMARVISKHPRTSNLLENFARRTTGGIVLIVGALMTLATLGVQIAPMLAALGAGGFIVGFALQETLGSFASGLMIMIYRPFDVDDYVTVADVSGTVKEMSLVSTTLLTFDNKVLVIPNKKAWADTITNFTGRDIRRVDLVFGIDYDDDVQKAIETLKRIANDHHLVLDDPPVAVDVDELADSSVNLFCRAWVETPNYWTVHNDLTRQTKLRFDAEGISFPYPQLDIHMPPAAVPTA